MPPRLITLTLNPALDIACSARRVVHTHKIHTRDDHLDPGGGGINVARVLRELGGDTLAVMMAGGVTGELIQEMLDAADVPHRNIPINGYTRICFNVFEPDRPGIPLRPGRAGRHRRRLASHAGGAGDNLLRLADCQRQPGAWHAEDIYARVALAAATAGQKLRAGHLGAPRCGRRWAAASS